MSERYANQKKRLYSMLKHRFEETRASRAAEGLSPPRLYHYEVWAFGGFSNHDIRLLAEVFEIEYQGKTKAELKGLITRSAIASWYTDADESK